MSSFILRHTLTRSTLSITTNRHLPSTVRLAHKEAQSRDSINTEPNEYSKTGGDAETARATEDTAFSKDKTKPEEQYEAAGRESGSKANPLDASPANQAISKGKGGEQGGAQGSKSETGDGGKRGASGGGSPAKHGKGLA